jgi:hypothetical protein
MPITRIAVRQVWFGEEGRILGADVIGSRRVRNRIRFPSHLLFRRLRNTHRNICCLEPPDNRRPDVYTWFARLTYRCLSISSLVRS